MELYPVHGHLHGQFWVCSVHDAESLSLAWIGHYRWLDHHCVLWASLRFGNVCVTCGRRGMLLDLAFS